MTRALLFVAGLSARRSLGSRGAMVGRAVFFALVLFVFSQLWDAVLETSSVAFAEPHQLVWYLAITEWLVLSSPPLHLEIEDEVRRGDLMYRLARPIAYPLAKLAEGLGDLLVRMAVLAVVGAVVAYAVTGQLPVVSWALLLLVPLGLASGMLAVLVQFGIGLSAFWIHDCRPLYWVWQKSLFILGGMFVPLEIYPPWLRELAIGSPCSAMLHGPASLALGLDATAALAVLARLLMWLVVVSAGLTWAFGRATRRLEIGGG